MPTLSIRRLANRVVAPDAETAWAAAPVLDSAVHQLPVLLEPLLERAAAMAGLPADAAVALRRLHVRLPFREEPDRLAKDWAAAIAATLAEACRGAMAAPGVAAGGPGSAAGAPGVGAGTPPAATDDTAAAAVFADVWKAEAAILGYLAAGAKLPWWSEGLLSGAPDAARIIGEWIERNPARAAVYLLDLLPLTAAAALLSPAAMRRLAGRLLKLVAIGSPAWGVERGGAEPIAHGWAGFWPQVPAWLRARIRALPADRRALFSLAALLVHAPAATLLLAGCAPESAWIETALGVLAVLPAAADPAAAQPGTPPEPRPEAEPAPGVGVMNGGLLLLLRPLLELGIVTAVPPPELPALLSSIGLLALQRVSAPLLPAARRVLLERDRTLLAAFAGTDPPDAPLDTLSPPALATHWVDQVLAAAPPDIGWAPGALSRYFGGPDPFGDATEGRLARLLLRPGRLMLTRWSAELVWPLASAEIALRRAGWDIDPGWLPWIGRVVRFRYDGTDAT